MSSELEKMERGEWYDANNDARLLEMRIKAKDLCFDLDHTRPGDVEKRKDILTQLLGYYPENLAMLTQKDALFNKKWSAYILSPSKCAWILVDIDKIIMKISLFVFYRISY